jgi:hypothetical protein
MESAPTSTQAERERVYSAEYDEQGATTSTEESSHCSSRGPWQQMRCLMTDESKQHASMLLWAFASRSRSKI